MAHYPVFLDLENKTCLVVGGGKIAERKVRSLLRAKAKVLCVSDRFGPGILRLIERGQVQGIRRRLSPKQNFSRWIRNVSLAIGATSSPLVNAKVYEACRRKNLLVNVVDDPDHSNFIAPAILRRGPLSIAISTGGASPLFAKTIRERMERIFGPEYGSFLRFMARERRKIMERLHDAPARKKLFQDLVRSGLLKLFRSRDSRAIRKKYESILARHISRRRPR